MKGFCLIEQVLQTTVLQNLHSKVQNSGHMTLQKPLLTSIMYFCGHSYSTLESLSPKFLMKEKISQSCLLT